MNLLAVPRGQSDSCEDSRLLSCCHLAYSQWYYFDNIHVGRNKFKAVAWGKIIYWLLGWCYANKVPVILLLGAAYSEMYISIIASS